MQLSSSRVKSLGDLAGMKQQIEKKKKKIELDAEFRRRFSIILNIVCPTWTCLEARLLLTQLFLLFSRTFLSIYVGMLEGYVVKGIMNADKENFLKGLGYWMLMSIPSSAVNSLIKYLTFRIATHFRTNLTHKALELYLRNGVYYGVVNLDGRIENADQMITTDVAKLSATLSELYCNLAKPVLDILIFGWKLSSMSGSGLYIGFGCYVAMGQALRMITPNFGKMVAEQAELEGVYRFCHSRLIQNCEEIAFYHGDEMEKRILKRTYGDVRDHTVEVNKMKIPHEFLDSVLLKYFSSVMGWCVSSVPIFMPSLMPTKVKVTDSNLDVASHYVSSRRFMLDMGDAVGRLFGSYKDVVEFAGYLARVVDMLETFEDVDKGIIDKNISADNQVKVSKFSNAGKTMICDNKGGVIFKNVPIVTPNGDVLVNSVNIQVDPGMHLLITGPNGCGKSSLFRILGGLWPVYDGELTRPAPRDIFYIPQRPYLSIGTFRDQIIYPHSAEEFRQNGKNDTELEEILAQVNLQYVLVREGGWNAEKNWKDALSGGEKQRVGLARLFYHRPRYAIMDECTSQVSIDWEGTMYNYAKQLGITLMTVSHRPSLLKYHDWVLHFDGEGNIKFGKLGKDNWMDVEGERREIEQKLREVPELEKRLKELKEMSANIAGGLDSI